MVFETKTKKKGKRNERRKYDEIDRAGNRKSETGVNAGFSAECRDDDRLPALMGDIEDRRERR